ncbi:hypothetical protein RJZ56_002353 [Blastomyces dermatitidis]|uniref:Uncharacterized protein n=2 Tax=Ajellomyces dermatitidis TaxID=5039 RepID=F2T6D0_AJEDA|nr:uncharacterized protein BDCG_06034 [Blastomyces dermatitidis ER-3]EEQ90914.2 hypothetical protein BDCG_06034 [Blastomyces dermatitidis ER-3]EGE78744.1 hypothetical protein BDDG_01681 [Blastomyces dermatitidis ATCC 18188]
MDAGVLAQMTYNNNMAFNGGSLGVPGSGFASRGKGSHIKRLSVPHPSNIGSINESTSSPSVSTPRTSRSHLLAGLRTAPKHSPAPATAPMSHQQPHFSLDHARYGSQQNSYAQRAPLTSTGASFPNHLNSYGSQPNGRHQMYSLPEHVLPPPTIDLPIDENGEPIDEKLYAELVSTNLFLAAQQQRLQEQLASVTAAAQQFQGLSLGFSMGAQQQIMSATTPGMGYYQQQAQQGMQPVVQQVPGHPGLFSVYNPMTGQQNFVMDNTVQSQQQQYEEPSSIYQEQFQSPMAETPTFRAEVSPPPESRQSPPHFKPSPSPPRTDPSPPQEVTPLPPPSANAFRRNHKKTPSLVTSLKINSDTNKTAPKTAPLPTPLTGTFGPGQARAGEHPIRQPRGPPSLEELIEKPTSKHEGSKNFVTRQRRRAVHNLVRAGLERRGESRSSRRTGSNSGGSVTPSSDVEFNFSGSDGDDSTGGNRSGGTLSSKPSLGSIRAAANGAIGSERKEKEWSYRGSGSGSGTSNGPKRGTSTDSLYTAATVSSDDGGLVGGKLMEIRADDTTAVGGAFGGRIPAYTLSPSSTTPSTAAVLAGHASAPNMGQGGNGRRKMPMFVLSSAEKRKSPIN